MQADKSCYICGGNSFVDDHHYDCNHGEFSPEVVPLCRRCHRTYHDLGIEWFDDEYLDRAIEIENKRRAILGGAKVTRADIKRSDYYYKKHGLLNPNKIRLPEGKAQTEEERLKRWIAWATQ